MINTFLGSREIPSRLAAPLVPAFQPLACRKLAFKGPLTVGPGSAGMPDSIMSRQSSFFGTASLTRAAHLAGPALACHRAIKERQNRECLGGLRRPELSVRAHSGTRPLARASGQCSMGSSTAFTRLALWSTIFAGADRPSASAVVSWSTHASGGFNFWETPACPDPRRPRGLESRCGGLGCRFHSAVLAPARGAHWNPGRGRDRRCLPTVHTRLAGW